MFGGLRCKIEEPKKRVVTRESKIDQPEDIGGNADRIESGSFQQRRTCHFFVVFPKTENQDENSLKMEQKNSFDDKRPHCVQPPNKLLRKNLQRNKLQIPTMEQQPQQMQEDGFLQNDGIMAQAAEKHVTRKNDILLSQGVYNMDLSQSPKMQKGKESDSTKPKPHPDDNLFPYGEHFDDKDLESLTEFLTHDEKCIFMEKLKCDSSGLLSRGESFQAETTLSPNKSSTIHPMLDENHSGNEQYFETRFSSGTNIIHKRKRNLEFGNEELVPKIKREIKKEILDHNIDHEDGSRIFLKRQNVASHMSKAEKSTDRKFHRSKLVRQKPMIECL
ncbi:hypothetical protein J437_LFUL001672 [Ladona fulva]|uniref:Uncharacterized protein n=1 Tax=Ladona fulva TaxID=123851 RepID=A0A8K0K707_LADFU|nr:hypothetical protein J437_LFUL001672 [Ladona fulva]